MVSSKRSLPLFRLLSEPNLTEASHHLMLDNCSCGRDPQLSKSNDVAASSSNISSTLSKPTPFEAHIRRYGASSMRNSHRMKHPSGTIHPQVPMTNKMAAMVSSMMAAMLSNKMAAVVTLSLLHCLLLPRVDAEALTVPGQEGYQLQQDKTAGGEPADFTTLSLHLPRPLGHVNPIFWVMRGKKSQASTAYSNQGGDDQEYPELETEKVNTSKNDISNHKKTGIEKREVRSASSWGSNPFLLGKRPFGLPYSFVSPKKYYGGGDDDESSVVLPEDEIALNNGLNRAMQSGKRRDGLFWATRGKRMDEVSDGNRDMNLGMSNKRSVAAKFPPSLIKEAIKNSGADNSKFWMTRGRRFWAARGKKEAAESVLSRLAHLVGPELKNKGLLYGLDEKVESDPVSVPGMGLVDMQSEDAIVDQPYFWVVRGKKSGNYLDGDDDSVDLLDDGEELSPYSPLLYRPDDLRNKKAFNKFSALARLNAKGLNGPNFWASRGRKNFWAARGKRSAPAADLR